VSSIPGKAPSVKLPPQIMTTRSLLLEQMGRLLTTEETLAKLVLPQVLLELEDVQLTETVSSHLAETRAHAGRLKEAFLALGELPSGRTALGLDGLRWERENVASGVAPGLRPFLACAAAMGMEHYEINAYEVAIRLAESEAGAEEAVRLLRANLEEEIAALQKLGGEADRLSGQLD
jgi:ferritin-like metal-binding protein YciE